MLAWQRAISATFFRRDCRNTWGWLEQQQQQHYHPQTCHTAILDETNHFLSSQCPFFSSPIVACFCCTEEMIDGSNACNGVLLIHPHLIASHPLLFHFCLFFIPCLALGFSLVFPKFQQIVCLHDYLKMQCTPLLKAPNSDQSSLLPCILPRCPLTHADIW